MANAHNLQSPSSVVDCSFELVLLLVLMLLLTVDMVAKSEDIQFVVSGVRRTLTASQVTKALKGTHPGTIQRHAVEIEGGLFPIKEAFSRATGLDLLDFNTNQARRVFQRLGFRVVRAG